MEEDELPAYMKSLCFFGLYIYVFFEKISGNPLHKTNINFSSTFHVNVSQVYFFYIEFGIPTKHL